MSTFTRSGHNRYRNGSYHWVEEHTVTRNAHTASTLGSKVVRWEWAHEDFTRATMCKHCGHYVYFIRHNGGSVWLNDLGYPWPKHECYDSTCSTTIYTMTTAASSKPAQSLFGVIIETGKGFRIRLSNGEFFYSLTKVNLSGFLGALVTLVPTDNKKWHMHVFDHDGHTLVVHEVISFQDAFASAFGK